MLLRMKLPKNFAESTKDTLSGSKAILQTSCFLFNEAGEDPKPEEPEEPQPEPSAKSEDPENQIRRPIPEEPEEPELEPIVDTYKGT